MTKGLSVARIIKGGDNVREFVQGVGNNLSYGSPFGGSEVVDYSMEAGVGWIENKLSVTLQGKHVYQIEKDRNRCFHGTLWVHDNGYGHSCGWIGRSSAAMDTDTNTDTSMDMDIE